MTGESHGGTSDPEVALTLTYVPPSRRDVVAALFQLDAQIGAVLRFAREPLLAQLRLTWWREALAQPDPAGRQPLLARLEPVMDAGLDRLVEGWEVLLQPELGQEDLDLYADLRGGTLFTAAGSWLRIEHPDIRAAGRIWAWADLARHSSRSEEATAALARAADEPLTSARWPVAGRMLGALARLARRDAARGASAFEAQVTPKRMFLALSHRWTGRIPQA